MVGGIIRIIPASLPFILSASFVKGNENKSNTISRNCEDNLTGGGKSTAETPGEGENSLMKIMRENNERLTGSDFRNLFRCLGRGEDVVPSLGCLRPSTMS